MRRESFERLRDRLARDLSLSPSERYSLGVLAARWQDLPDHEVLAAAHAAADAHGSGRTAGAALALGLGLVEHRYSATLSPTERQAHEWASPGLGARGLDELDSGVLSDEDVTEAREALAAAHAAEARGDRETAARIRAAVPAQLAADPPAGGDGE